MRLHAVNAIARVVLTVVCLVSARYGWAQADSLALSSGVTASNGTVSLNLTLNAPAGSAPAAIEWSLTYPSANVVSISATAGPALASAGKSLVCASSSGKFTCIAYSLSTNVIPNGVVATVNLTIASGVTATVIGVSNSSAASGSGTAISVSATGGNITGSAALSSLFSLSAAYGLDEGTGTTTADASGNGVTGQIQGATWTSAGKHGKGLSFNGSSSYVDLGTPASLQNTGSMTWSAWVYAAGNPPDDGQIVARSDGSSGWQLKTSPDTGVRTFGIAVSPSGSGHTQRYSKTVVALNTWYYVAGVYNAAAQTLDIYVNGVLDDGVLTGTVPASQVLPAVNSTIGMRSGGFYFNGIVDDLRIYNRALSAAEIQADMNTAVGSTGSTASPTISSLQCSPSSLASGASLACTITLSAVAPSGGSAVTLSDNSTALTTPALVTVGAGATSSTFTVTAGSITSDQSATITATLSGVSKTATISLASALTLSTLVCTPATLGSSASSSCTVMLSKAATTATAVTLSDSSALLTTPASVTVAPGATSATFTVTAGSITSDQSATITATLSGISKTATIALSATVKLSSLACTPTVLGSNVSGTCSVSLNKAAPTGGTVISLSDNSALLTTPISVTVPGGATSATFTVTAGSITSDLPVTVTATLNGVSQSAIVSLTTGSMVPSVFMDSPASGAVVSGTITVNGWAIESTTAVGRAISSVNVLVDGVTVGSATYGTSRPDVCAVWPGRPGCPNVGYTYSLNTSSLSPGSHSLSVIATDSARISSTWTSNIIVASSPSVFIEGPTSGSTISGTITVSGWAIDSTTDIGSAITSVKVLVDGVVAGTAAYGISRPDVCTVWPGRPGCPNVGFAYSLNTAGLMPGSHTITVSATNSNAVTGTARTSVTVGSSLPAVVIESPTAGSVVSGIITVSGWSVDYSSVVGTAISSIQVLVDGAIVGAATYGINRPDVCAVWPGRPGCPNVGYVYLLNTANLSAGAHTLTVSATNSSTPPASGSSSVTFTVLSRQTVSLNSPTAGAVVSGMLTVSGWTTPYPALRGRTSSPVTVKVDGNFVGNAISGISRPDVCRLHHSKSLQPASGGDSQADCSAVGFVYLLDTRTIAPGLHLLTVSTDGADGTKEADSWTINFNVLAAGDDR